MHRGPGVHHGQKRAERVWLGWSSRHAFRVVELDGGLEPCSALISPLHPCDLPRGIHDRKHSAGSEGGASASVGPSCDSGQVRSEGLPSVVVHSSIAIRAVPHMVPERELTDQTGRRAVSAGVLQSVHAPRRHAGGLRVIVAAQRRQSEDEDPWGACALRVGWGDKAALTRRRPCVLPRGLSGRRSSDRVGGLPFDGSHRADRRWAAHCSGSPL